MKKILLLCILVCLSVCVNAQTAYYESDSGPTAAVTVVPTGIVLQLEGGNPVTFSPMGMNNQFMFYSCGNANVTFTLNMQSMVITMNGQNYPYTLSKMQNTTNVPYNPSYEQVPSGSSSNRAYCEAEIRQLEYKIRDAERSLRLYEEWNRKDPSISNSQLVSSQRRLIKTYQDRIQELIRQMR